jgi:hypothetical protein
MTGEHLEPIPKSEVPQLADIDAEDMHIIDYDDGAFHCTEIFTHEGAYRGYAVTKEESLDKAVDLYKKTHQQPA